MDKWEYNAIDFTAFLRPGDISEDSLDDFLGGFGKDGWELAGILDNVWFIFKRKLRKLLVRRQSNGK